ncbi:MAG: DUF4307 domain-containing protein [Dermatophilaceae bacterium]
MPIPHPAPGATKWWVVVIGWIMLNRILTIGIVLGCAMAVWLGLASTSDKATAQDIGYRVVDDRTVDVTYRVSRPAGRDVTCVIRALDKGFATVGLVEVHIPGSDASTVQRTTRVRTTTRAVTGLVRSCSVG